jgi:predicted acylesterase/phospholipase RssA
MKKKLKIGIIMSGAVSLGNFEAGVITELFCAIDKMNKEIASNAIYEKYEVDVITGASAGALTAGLAASIMMNNYDKLDNIGEAWVSDVSIDKLLHPGKTNLLDSNAVRRIAESKIIKEFKTRASFAPMKLYIGFTITNLNGFDRLLKFENGEESLYTYFNDSKIFSIEMNEEENKNYLFSLDSNYEHSTPSDWENLQDFAIASGCFPFAFDPILLQRDTREYDFFENLSGRVQRVNNSSYYIDGGTFNNEPIGLAISLGNHIDRGDKKKDSDRIYIFINANNSDDGSIFEKTVIQRYDKPDKLLSRLLAIVHKQSRSSDYISSLVIDQKIKWRENLYNQIVTIINEVSLENESTKVLISNLNELSNDVYINSNEKAFNTLGNDYSEKLKLVKENYSNEFSRIRPDQPEQFENRKEILTRLFYIFDNIAFLQNRNNANILLINKGKNKLAGEDLGWFGGFFDINFRIYNYYQGRDITQKKLAGFEKYFGEYSKENYDNKFMYQDIAPNEIKYLPDQTLENMSPEKLNEFYDKLTIFLYPIVDDFVGKLGFFERNLIRFKILRNLKDYVIRLTQYLLKDDKSES